jgi:hypothetical protein
LHNKRAIAQKYNRHAKVCQTVEGLKMWQARQQVDPIWPSCEGCPPDRSPRTFFASQQLLLAFDAPTVAAECAVLSHDPVAGDCPSQRIGGTRACHRPHRCRGADTGGYLGITQRAARWDLAKRRPDTPLEGCALEVEWQGAALRRRLKKIDDVLHPAGKLRVV